MALGQGVNSGIAMVFWGLDVGAIAKILPYRGEGGKAVVTTRCIHGVLSAWGQPSSVYTVFYLIRNECLVCNAHGSVRSQADSEQCASISSQPFYRGASPRPLPWSNPSVDDSPKPLSGFL